MTHPNSLENLKKGAESRKTGKIRHHYTILPEHHAWLTSGGNASIRLGEMISKILAGELVGIQHLRKAEAEIERLRKQSQSISVNERDTRIRNELNCLAKMAREKEDFEMAKKLDLLRSEFC